MTANNPHPAAMHGGGANGAHAAGHQSRFLAPLADCEFQARSISHWFPYDRVGVVNVDP